MEITYTLVGDYYRPNLVAPESPKVGRWGMLRFNYLRKYREALYTIMLAIQETLMREHHAELDEQMIHSFLRYGTVGIDEELERTMKLTASDYAKKVFRKLREHGYDPRIMKLYVVDLPDSGIAAASR